MNRTTNRGTRRIPALAMAGVLASAAGLGGCVSQKAYDDLVHENRALKSRNVELQGRVDDLSSAEAALRRQLSAAPDAMAGLESAHALTLQQLNEARQTIAELERRLDSMDFAQLDPVTDDALRRLAQRYPDLIRYDADRGMLQFASDLTFDSGSAEVKAEAKRSLAVLADILKTPDAAGYDVRIVGHTDSQRISARTAPRHPTNMHLSAHRAISVRDELVTLGVPAPRVMAAGWGEFRPAVPNTASGNTPANRRVEIYLFPGTGNSYAPTTAAPSGTGAEIDRASIGGGAYEPTK
jgi:chemotaxis protein MotB